MITNVRVTSRSDPLSHQSRAAPNACETGSDPGLVIESNFTVHRFRRGEQVSQYVGRYRHHLRMVEGQPKIALREAILDAHELASLGAVSFIL
jgi:3-phenylpropionate/cinnamic acid dioxygenase small subunit